ncbi:DNA polymerase III PolC [Salmonella enterica subsp. enterica serovar Typhimurium str. DT104]|nr:DNA polymerase III PolC [Salmonella enterica subsp. enterica serovar Typhimurium str. DT104]
MSEYEKKMRKIIKYFGLIHLDLDFILEEKPVIENKFNLDLETVMRPLEYNFLANFSEKNKKIIDFELIDLKFIRSHKNPNVQFDAQIYKISPIKTKTGGLILKIFLNNNDYTEAVSVSKFLIKNQNYDLKVGDLVNIKAKIKDPTSRYKSNVDLNLYEIKKIDSSIFFPNEKLDTAKIKRVEIAART